MKIQIKRIDKSLPLPEYKTDGSVGFDLYARENTSIKPKEILIVPGNFIIKTPPGYMLIITPRSSTPKKKGLMMPNSIGIIDQDYCGEKDELGVLVYNFTDEVVEITRGERFAQGIFVRVDKANWDETDEAEKNSRGGFGSTGSN